MSEPEPESDRFEYPDRSPEVIKGLFLVVLFISYYKYSG
jgi:hypothetical protein